jgi:hypothetical protein
VQSIERCLQENKQYNIQASQWSVCTGLVQPTGNRTTNIKASSSTTLLRPHLVLMCVLRRDDFFQGCCNVYSK